MSVSSITSSTASGLNQVNWRSTVKQGKQDFGQLLGALQSGDVSGAQQAYAAMQQLLPVQAATPADSSGATSGGANSDTVKADFSALGKALSSGSLTGAQDAVAQLQKDAQAYRQAHPSHGHLDRATDVYKSMQQSADGATNASPPAGSSNPLDADMAALGQALQSGNASSAQSAYAKLQQDLQSIQMGTGHHHHHHSATGGRDPMSSYIANSVLGGTATTASSSSGASPTNSNPSLADAINSAHSSGSGSISVSA